MNTSQVLLKKIAAIQTMERGTLCPMQDGRYYNHQTWQNGRNVVRYVPRSEVKELKKAIAGYRRFMKLTRQYADLLILASRKKRKKDSPAQTAPSKRRKVKK